MKIINSKIILSLAIILLLGQSCNDYLDIDKPNPNNPEDVPLNGLLTAAEVSISNDFGYNPYVNDVLLAYVHQDVIREEGGKYDITTSNIPVQNSWNNIYAGTLPQLEKIIKDGTATNNLRYVGIAQILKAFTMTRVVDLWGDAPYSEATLNPNTNINPKFDKGIDIYKDCFILIDKGIANLTATSTNGQALGAADLIYGGDLVKWRKFANTYKLNMYNKVRLTSLYDASAVSALLTGGQLISSITEDFQFNYTSTLSPSDERNQLFIDEYGGAQITHYVSPFLYEMQRGKNPNIFTGIVDPRRPYYYVNQLKPNATPSNPTDYYDAATGFLSIRFGSTGPNVDQAQRPNGTMMGNYICGGRFDDGQGKTSYGNKQFDVGAATGRAPLRMLTLYDRFFIEAELIQSGMVSGTANTALTNGINAAFAKVNQVAALSSIVQIPTGTQNTYVTDVMNKFTAANATKKLEIIMTQKWLANFGSPLECYNDFRRTGFPTWPDPNGASPEYALIGLNDVETSLSRSYPLSEFWPSSELDANPNAPAQKVPTTFKVFWDN